MAANWTVAAVPVAGLFGDTPQLLPDPQTPGTMYLAARGGVLKTTDGGGHWTFANSGLRALGVRSVQIDPQSGSLLVAQDTNMQASPGPSLLESSDGGASWVAAGVGLPLLVGNPVADPHDSRTLYLWSAQDAHSIGFFQSTDGGGRWISQPSQARRALALPSPSLRGTRTLCTPVF